ncbi:hypothetical protein [Aquabacterium sp.]|nr:hypothetical protein [Aquabacterium sp.]|tara:strand:+ start:3023 stop:3469 length:447 start_codon:yes stop_codon:yes gene_type:complete
MTHPMTHPLMHRLQHIWHSYRSLPLWVQVWVGAILVPVNALSFLLLHTPTGQWAAWAALFVVATNVPIMWVARGMSKLMSVPHLIAWLPLQVALLARLAGQLGATPLQPFEQPLILALLLTNGISLVFDAIDSVRWLQGDRAVPGMPS